MRLHQVRLLEPSRKRCVWERRLPVKQSPYGCRGFDSYRLHSDVAQRIEQPPSKRSVGGSIPLVGAPV